MKKTTAILLSIIFVSTLCVKANIKENIYTKLNKNKTISYSINKLTIQGSSTREKFSNDTLFIKTYSSAQFSRIKTDSVFGYHFVLIDSLIHPHFKIPMKTIEYYKDNTLISSLVSPMKNSYTEKDISELDPDRLENINAGQISDMIFILKNKETKQLNDTIINKENCIHFSTIRNGIANSLFVSKKTQLPIMLRVTSNTFQPFIEEYYYSNFIFNSKFYAPNFSKSKEQSPITNTLIKTNDILPNWTFDDLEGNKVSFEKSGKYKIIYLSMINCGPCQVAIPYVDKMYNFYNKTENIDFFVFYPIDPKENLEKYIARKNIKTQIVYNSLLDNNKRFKVINQLNMGFPAILIVDKDNQIKYIVNGVVSSKFEEIVKEKIDLLTTEKL